MKRQYRFRAAAAARRRLGIRLGISLMLAAVGLQLYVGLSQAATYTAHSEAEAGALAGTTAATADTLASGSKAVKFGGAVPSKVGGCVKPAGVSVQDIASGSGNTMGPPWRHKLKDAAIIYINTTPLNAEYNGYVNDAITTWNASPCIDFRNVKGCPSSSNCVATEMTASSPAGTDFDGQFSWSEGNGYISKGTLTFVTGLLNKNSVAYRRMVTAHELGHAASLGHRKTTSDLMYASSGASSSLIADLINRNNILATYGVASNATTTSLGTNMVYDQAGASNVVPRLAPDEIVVERSVR